MVTICDLAPESVINESMPYFLLDLFVINIPLWIISSMKLFADSFSGFSSYNNPFICGCSFCNNRIDSYYLLCSFWSLIFFLDYLVTVFLDMSNVVAIVTIWYIFSTWFIKRILHFATIFPRICAGTLVLGFYIKGFSYSLELFLSYHTFIKSYLSNIFNGYFQYIEGICCYSICLLYFQPCSLMIYVVL